MMGGDEREKGADRDMVDEILQQVLAGDLPESDERVRRCAEEHTSFQRELDELRALTQSLEADADLERRTIQEAEAMESAPGDEHVNAMLGRLRGEFERDAVRPEPPPSDATIVRPNWGRRWAVAAAAMLLVAIVWWTQRPTGSIDDSPEPIDPPKIYLGDPDPSIHLTVVDRSSWPPRQYRWTVDDLGAGAAFKVHVVQPRESVNETAIAPIDVFEPEWTLPDDLASQLPSRFAIVVEVIELDRSEPRLSEPLRLERPDE